VIVNHAGLRLASVLGGLGLAYLPEDQILDHVAQGRLIRVLEDWCEPFPGYHLYYPSRHHASSAFGVVVEALRYRGG
jgi:DNA-binding transcriptional LysR family regulator